MATVNTPTRQPHMTTTPKVITIMTIMVPLSLPSCRDPKARLTDWNGASSHLTLWIMLIVTLIFLPLVLAYTAWVMKVLFGRISLRDVRTNPDFY